MNYPHPGTPGDYNNPLSHMSPPSSVDPMNNVNNMNSDIHSSVDIKNHMNQYLPTSSDTTPLRHPDSSNTCGTPSNQSQNHNNGSHVNHGTPNGNQTNNSGADNNSNNIGDLNFDPSSVIDGEGHTPGLDVSIFGDFNYDLELYSVYFISIANIIFKFSEYLGIALNQHSYLKIIFISCYRVNQSVTSKS